MSVFDFSKSPDINEGVKYFLSVQNGILLDVRSKQEYVSGHIPGSRNVPLHRLDDIADEAEDLNTPLFVYCHSGVRSRRAVEELRDMGYLHAYNLGGIAEYHGFLDC